MCRRAYSLPILSRLLQTRLCFLPLSKTQPRCSRLTHIHKCLQGLLKTMSYIRVLRRGGYIEATACATEANSLQAGLMEQAVRCCCRRDSWPCPLIEDLYFPPYFHSWTLAWLCYRKSPNGPLRERQQQHLVLGFVPYSPISLVLPDLHCGFYNLHSTDANS